MAKLKEDNDWFVPERTRTLALVALTRREDLDVNNGSELDHLDLLVDLTKKKKLSHKRFGVVLHGNMERTSLRDANIDLQPTLRSFLKQRLPSFPVCLFYFTMRDNQAYYTWILEPLLQETGEPRLRKREVADCKMLDHDSLDAIVTQVSKWYDALLIDAAV